MQFEIYKNIYEQNKGVLFVAEKNVIKLDNLIKKYIESLEEHNIHISKVYLFGSYAKGSSKEFSDIDIAIISKSFTGFRFEDKMTILPLRRAIDSRIEPVPFRPEDFNQSDPLAAEIISTGKRII